MITLSYSNLELYGDHRQDAKIVWGRSGNRCAICRQPLVVDQTYADTESAVGDECHIISGAPNEPRHESSFSIDRLDVVDNLMLLCHVHHKMLDDQCETYTANLLRNIKANHEKWVDTRFNEVVTPSPVRIRRLPEEIPQKLMPMTSGADLMNLVVGCHGSYIWTPAKT